MNDRKTFVSQVMSLFKGNLLHAFSQVLVITLLTYFGGSESAGEYVLALSITAPVFLFLDLNLRVVRATDQDTDSQFWKYIALRVVTLCVAIVVIYVIYIMFLETNVWILCSIVFYRIGESLSNLSYGAMQRVQAGHSAGRSLVLKGLLTIIILSVIVPVSSGNALVTAIAMASVSLCWSIVWDLRRAFVLSSINIRKVGFLGIKRNINFQDIFQLAKKSSPLGLDAGITSLALNAPKYFIEAWLGTEALGVFGLLWQLTYSMQKLIGAIGHAGVSRLAKYKFDDAREKFWRLLNKLVVSTVLIGVFVVFFGTLILPWVLGHLLGPTYSSTSVILALLVSSALAGLFRIIGRAVQALSLIHI